MDEQLLQVERLEKESNIYVFEVDETIKKHQMEKIGEVLDKHTNGEPFKLLIAMNGFSGFDDFDAFKSLVVVKFKALKILGNLEKYALLTNDLWMDPLVAAENFLVASVPIRTFRLSERAKALEWLAEKGE